MKERIALPFLTKEGVVGMMLEEFIFNMAMLFLAMACVVWIEKQLIKVVIWVMKETLDYDKKDKENEKED